MTRCLLQRSPPRPPTQRLTQKTSESKNKAPSAAGGGDGSGGGLSALRPHRFQSPFRPLAADRGRSSAGDEGQQHISVIHATGCAARKTSSVAGGTSRGETASLSPKLVSSSSPHSPPPEPNSVGSSPKALAVSLSSSPTPFSISLTKPSTLFASPRPRHKPKVSTPPRDTERVDSVTGGRPLHLNSLVSQVSFFSPFHRPL